MIRKLSVSLLMLVAIVSVLSIASQAAPQALLTQHVPDAVLNGEAKAVGHLPAGQTMRFDIVLQLRHEPELENFVQDVYDPTSPNYRHFVTVKEFTERFGPSQEDYDALIAFAKASGFTMTGGSRDAMDVQFKASVAAIERAFHVSMNVYQHPTESRTFYSPDREPTADAAIRLFHVSGLDNFSLPHPTVQKRDVNVNPNATTGSCPEASFCGSDMRAAYYGGSLTGSGQVLGLLEYAGYDIADVNTYYTNAKQKLTATITGISTDGTSVTCLASQGCDDTEQTLDITQAAGMAPGLSTIYVYVGSTDTALLSSMSSHTPLPLQLSASWTWNFTNYVKNDNPFFEKMAAQGQSYFQAAGDSGAYNSGSQFVWPADSQYVTTVGGTDLTTTKAGGPWASETAWVDGGGGYYSPDGIPIPKWQQLAGVITKANQGSTTLRNSPDVSANSNFTFYVCADQSGCTANEYGGTSFATPMWAGYMALVNEQIATNGGSPIGFVNPAIYNIGVSSSYNTDFHDITSGSNGLPTTPGFDDATGWGSPNGGALITALAGSGGAPGITFTPSSLTFGKIVVGKTSAPKVVTVTNSGSGSLSITNIAASGDFALEAYKGSKKKPGCTNGSTVAAGAVCVVKVTFTPTQAGTRTGDVTFTDNASGSPQQVPLTGTGKAAE